MITDIFLAFLILQIFSLMGFLIWAWQKVSVFLTWNTRYNAVEYEQAVTAPKAKRSKDKPIRTEQRGRTLRPVDDLVDLTDLPFNDAYAAIEREAA